MTSPLRKDGEADLVRPAPTHFQCRRNNRPTFSPHIRPFLDYLIYLCKQRQHTADGNQTNHIMNDKKTAYSQTLAQAKCLVEGVTNRVGALANITALFKDAFPHYFWVGFYIVEDGQLQLGPFQGPVACYSIGMGRGVCGTAWERQQTLVVPDVELFPGHIACSSRSRSEIVVPVFKGDTVTAVIDVDSEQAAAFDADDQEGLEQLARICSDLF